jgi:ATP-binding cassette subfamily B protein
MTTRSGQGQQGRPEVRHPFEFGPRGGPGMGFGHTARAEDPRGTVHRLWDYLRRQRWALLAVAFMVLLSTMLGLLGPYLLGRAIDEFITAGDLPGLARLVALMLVAYAALSFTTWLQSILMIRVSQATVRDMRRDLFAKFQALPLQYFDERTHGDLMSRMTNDIENVNTVLSTSVISFISAVITLPAVVIAMLLVNVPLALVSLTVVPMMAAVTRWIARHSRQGFRDQQAALGTLNGLIEESISGERVVVAYGLAPVFTEQFDAANAQVRDAAIRATTFSGLVGPVGNLVSNLSFAIIATAGGLMAVAGLATVGAVVAFLSYSEQLRRPILDIAALFNTIQAALAGAERVFAVLDEPPEEAGETWERRAEALVVRSSETPLVQGGWSSTSVLRIQAGHPVLKCQPGCRARADHRAGGTDRQARRP